MCVCKAWNCLIKDPSFISSHLNKQSENPSRKLFLAQRPGKMRSSLYLDDQEFSKYTTLQLGPLNNSLFEIAGSCNGLILLADYHFNYMICNPNIRKYVRLPTPCLSFSRMICYFWGIGFASARNDYKVLKISIKDDHNLTSVGFELYSHKENSWKILAPPPKYYYFPYDPLVSVNGVVHWIGSCLNSEIKYVLMGFDMGDEVYKEIMLPESVRMPGEWAPYHKLSSIAVSIYKKNELKIWVVKEYGVVETWTKMFSFRTTEPTNRFPTVRGFRRNGGLILKEDGDMVSQDVESSADKNVVLPTNFDYVFSYVESLVLIDADNAISYAVGDEVEATNDSTRKEREKPSE